MILLFKLIKVIADGHLADPEHLTEFMHSAAMAVCCSREGQLFNSAEALMDCAGSKVDLSRQTGSTEVAM